MSNLREECMHEMDSSMPGAPTVMVVDAGDVFVGGRYHSLVPILRFVNLDRNECRKELFMSWNLIHVLTFLCSGRSTREAGTSTTQWR